MANLTLLLTAALGAGPDEDPTGLDREVWRQLGFQSVSCKIDEDLLYGKNRLDDLPPTIELPSTPSNLEWSPLLVPLSGLAGANAQLPYPAGQQWTVKLTGPQGVQWLTVHERGCEATGQVIPREEDVIVVDRGYYRQMRVYQRVVRRSIRAITRR